MDEEVEWQESDWDGQTLCTRCNEHGVECKLCEWPFCDHHKKGHECIQLLLFSAA